MCLGVGVRASWEDAHVTEHRHEIPMRWADLDSLNHVNNVVYLRHAANARAMVEDLPEGPIGTMDVQFKRPIFLGPDPVVVTTRIDQQQVHQSIGVRGSDLEFASVTTGFGGYLDVPPVHSSGNEAPLALRHSDVDESGQIGAAQVFELFQETRIPYFRAIAPTLTPGDFVVAHIQVRYHRPIWWRAEPLTVRAWMSRVGNSSFSAETQLTDEQGVLASSSADLVGFDAVAQKARQVTDVERAAFTAALG